jgi:hypothetical protein
VNTKEIEMSLQRLIARATALGLAGLCTLGTLTMVESIAFEQHALAAAIAKAAAGAHTAAAKTGAPRT